MKSKRHFRGWPSAVGCATFGLALVLLLAPSAHSKKSKKQKDDVIDQLRIQNDDAMLERAANTEVLVSLSEEKAIQQLLKLIRAKRGSPIEPDLYLRLAELYMRRSKTTRFFELTSATEGQGKTTKPLIIKNKTTAKYLKQAIDTYSFIQKKFPRFKNMDLVLFNSAFALQQIGNDSQADRQYFRVISDYPKSPLVPDSHLAIGEMRFGKQQYEVALEHFLAVKKYRNSRVYPYGMYKAAWAYYNLGNSSSAIRELESVVDFGRKVESEGLDVRLDLRREALADMPILFEDVYAASQALEYFRKWAGEDEVGKSLVRMASIYERHGKKKSERIVLRSLIAELQDDPRRPVAHNNLVLSFESDYLRPEALAELEALHKICLKDSPWYRKNRSEYEKALKRRAASKSDPESGSDSLDPENELVSMPECREIVDRTSVKLAAKWQRLWAKNEKVPLFGEVSKKAYIIYLFEKPEDDTVNESRFHFAELLFQRKEFREASKYYAIVARTSEIPNLRHDAGYGSLVSLEKAVADVWSDEDERLFQTLADTYVTRNPKGKYVVDIEFKMAFIAYEKKRYDEAYPRLKKLGHKYPNSPRGIKAQDLYLDILNIKKDFTGLKFAAKNLMKINKDSSRRDLLSKIYQESYFSEIQKVEEKGLEAPAIAEYQRFAKENPGSPLAADAIWNSAQLQEKSFEHFAFAQSMLGFHDSFPKDRRAKDALLLAAKRFEDLGELERAAQCLDKLALVDSNRKNKWSELAVDFYYIVGDLALARRQANVVRRQLKGEELNQFLVHLVDNEKIYGDEKSLSLLLRELAKQNLEPYRTQELVKNIENLYENKKYKEAFSLAKDLVGSKSASSTYKARARLIQAKILEHEFREQSVKASVSRIALVLAIKTEKLAKAQEAYQAAMKFGDARTNVEALRGLSSSFSHYGQALRSIQLPTSVPKEDVEAFHKEIDGLVIPMEEKSVEALAQALEQAQKAAFYDGTVLRLQGELNKLNLRNEKIIELEMTPIELALPKLSGGRSS